MAKLSSRGRTEGDSEACSSGDEMVTDEAGIEDETKREIEYKMKKQKALTEEWVALQEDIEKNLMVSQIEKGLTLEEIGDLKEAVEKVLAGSSMQPAENKSLVKALGSYVDGSKLSFIALSSKLAVALEQWNIDIKDNEASMKLLDYLAQKEELFRKRPSEAKVQPCPVFELRSLDIFRLDDELSDLYDKQVLRRKTLLVLDKLAVYIQALERARMDKKSLSLIDACERKYTAAKTRLNQETVSKIG